MSHKISRRDFLISAGGVTFLALTPIARGLFAAPEAAGTGMPLFTAVPYIQPGSGSLLIPGKEEMILAWQTENKDADFKFVYGLSKKYGKTAKITRNTRLSGDAVRLNYAAKLENLPLGTKVFYKVTGNGVTIAEGYTTTRQPRGTRVRFAAIGDNACQNEGNRNVCHQAYLSHPDFVVSVGDNAYNQGLDAEYSKYFFMVYNADAAEPGVGAPILRSVPYYTVLGNHDLGFNDPETKRGWVVADFDSNSGALGYYTNMYLPANGPAIPPSPTRIRGSAERLAAFRKAAGSRFPQMANYSFDYGDIHFLCLDSNLQVDTTNVAYQKWIADDLKNTDATWKFVILHHQPFNVGDAHYREQHMRMLVPTFEAGGVDFVLGGHEHIYQRSMPLRFAPDGPGKAADLYQEERLVPGKFTIDREFDGQNKTVPKGILHIVTGAGGQNLHDKQMNNNPAEWTHQRDNHEAYVSKLVSDRHSYSLFDVGDEELTMTQVDQHGNDIDRIRVTKV
ncbi:hypothetical protein EON80_15340 [bacterium]|nr:MAG: hypothetical protein EON80_15340 [bacterium]